jgi:hypothetical protein
MKLESSRQIFDKYYNIKFRENPSGRRRVAPCRERERKTMTLIVAYRNVAQAPKNLIHLHNTADVHRNVAHSCQFNFPEDHFTATICEKDNERGQVGLRRNQ